jgi:hypothetical protein
MLSNLFLWHTIERNSSALSAAVLYVYALYAKQRVNSFAKLLSCDYVIASSYIAAIRVCSTK